MSIYWFIRSNLISFECQLIIGANHHSSCSSSANVMDLCCWYFAGRSCLQFCQFISSLRYLSWDLLWLQSRWSPKSRIRSSVEYRPPLEPIVGLSDYIDFFFLIFFFLQIWLVSLVLYCIFIRGMESIRTGLTSLHAG